MADWHLTACNVDIVYLTGPSAIASVGAQAKHMLFSKCNILWHVGKMKFHHVLPPSGTNFLANPGKTFVGPPVEKILPASMVHGAALIHLDLLRR